MGEAGRDLRCPTVGTLVPHGVQSGAVANVFAHGFTGDAGAGRARGIVGAMR